MEDFLTKTLLIDDVLHQDYEVYQNLDDAINSTNELDCDFREGFAHWFPDDC